jgi:hypothetical protein
MATKPTAEQTNLTIQYHSELARYSTTLFASTLVALTFLLLAGLRNPKMLLLVFLYITMASFVLSLVSYLVIRSLSARLAVATVKEKEAKLTKALSVVQVIQQVLFVIGLIGISGFAIEVVMLLFPAAGAASSGASSSAAPTQ